MKLWHSQHNSRVKLSQEEILAISQEISRKFPLSVLTTTPELVIVPVDPYHLYAYWNLGKNLNAYWNDGGNKQNVETKNDLENHLTLRIYSQPSHDTDTGKTKIWFDVPIHNAQSQQKIRLPSYETAYSAAVGKRYLDNRFVVFAYSNIINVPADKMAPYQPREEIKRSLAIAQNALSAKQTVPNKSTQSNTGNEVISGVRNVDTLYKNETKEPLNPELAKGFEVTLSPVKKSSTQAHSNNLAAKHFDETLINSINQNSFPEKNNTLALASKIVYSETSHFASNNASGLGNHR